MLTVSLCMIVKNEEKVLGRCLDSVKDAMDEIIIVDTGSSDRTKEIAARYTDRIFDFEWTDDFAAARNFSFSKASMDFIMWLDADDILTKADFSEFLRLKQELPNEVDVVMMRYNTAFDEEGKPVFSYYRERMVRRTIPHEWKGRVHEAIVCNGQTYYAESPAVTHKSIKTGYSDRNLRIYEKQIRDGEKLAPRDMFYYGRELYYHKRYERSIEVLTAFLSNPDGWVENKIEACKILSYCRSASGNLYGALEALAGSFLCAAPRADVLRKCESRSSGEALLDSLHAKNCSVAEAGSGGIFDAPRAEICCEIGNLYMRLGQYRNAIPWFKLALMTREDVKSGAFISEDSHGYLPCIQLCVCHDRLGEYEKAEEYNRQAGTYRPSSAAFLQNLKYFEQRRRS